MSSVSSRSSARKARAAPHRVRTDDSLEGRRDHFRQLELPGAFLGQFLLRNGKITAEQYEESRRRVTPQLRHGKLLVQMGAISPKDLWWGVKNQVLEIIYSLFGWKDGEFAFYDSTEDLAQERIVIQLNTSSVIMEGIRRLDEAARIREKIPNLDVVSRACRVWRRISTTST
jgi:hypothetical protein